MTHATMSREVAVGKTAVRLQQGDLTALAVDAVVHYARESLQLGSGFGTGIQVRGGDAVRKELEKLGHVEPGEAVITGGGALKARYVIHACGPKFQEADTEAKLRRTMRSALAVAARDGLKTVAFPPMGAGFYGVPLDLCAKVMLETIADFADGESALERILICVVDRREFAAFDRKLSKLSGAVTPCTK